MKKPDSNEQHSTEVSPEQNSALLFNSSVSTLQNTIGPYRLLERLGEGGMGTVFLAEQQSPIQRTVAVKVIKDGIQTKSMVDRFKFERQTLANLHHPNISTVLDVGSTQDGIPYFAMELVSGKAITGFCDEHCYDIKSRLKVFRTACSAISYAHQKGVLHRDIKPSNILVEPTADGFRLKVIDFGLAKIVEIDSAAIKQNEVIGTLAYMSPEQASGDQESTDTRSDIYSLGMVLFELLLGNLPNQNAISQDESDEKTIITDTKSTVPNLSLASSQIRKDTTRSIEFYKNRRSTKNSLFKVLREDLDWILAKSTAEKPEDRYQNCDELIADIDRFLNGDPVTAHPNTLKYVTSKWISKNRSIFTLSVFLATVLLTSLFVGWYLAWWAHSQMVAQKEATRVAKIAKKHAEESEKETKEALVSQKKAMTAANKAKQRAVQSDSRSRATLDLILNSFVQLDPSNSGREMLAGDALFSAYNNVDHTFEDDPVGKAEILKTLGQAFMGLGHAEFGKKVSTRALKLYEKHLGSDHVDALDTRISLIRINILEPTAENTQFLKESRKLSLKSYDPNSLVHLRIQMLFASHLMNHEDGVEEGLNLFEDAVTKIRDSFGPTHYSTLISKSEFAKVLFNAGKFEKGLELAYSTLEEMERVFPPSHPNTLIGKMRVAQLETRMGNYEKSDQLYREIIEKFDKAFSPEHPDSLSIKLQWVGVLNELGKSKQAEEVSKNVMNSFIRTNGKKHYLSLSAMEQYALAMSGNGKFEKALRVQKIVYETRLEQEGKKSGSSLISGIHLANLYRKIAKLEEGYRLFSELEKSVDYSNPNYTFQARQILEGLAICCVSTKRYEKSIAATEKRLKIEHKYLASNHTAIGESNELLAKIYFTMRNYEKSHKYFATAKQIYNANFQKNGEFRLLQKLLKIVQLRAACFQYLKRNDQFHNQLLELIDFNWQAIEITENPNKAGNSSTIAKLLFQIHSLQNSNSWEGMETLDIKKQLQKVMDFQSRNIDKNHNASIMALSIYTRVLDSEFFFRKAIPLAKECERRCQQAMKQNPGNFEVMLIHFFTLQQQVALYLEIDEKEKSKASAEKTIQLSKKILKTLPKNQILLLQTITAVQVALGHDGWTKEQKNQLKKTIDRINQQLKSL